MLWFRGKVTCERPRDPIMCFSFSCPCLFNLVWCLPSDLTSSCLSCPRTGVWPSAPLSSWPNTSHTRASSWEMMNFRDKSGPLSALLGSSRRLSPFSLPLSVPPSWERWRQQPLWGPARPLPAKTGRRVSGHRPGLRLEPVWLQV